MEKLIKIQSLIMDIEEMTIFDKKHYSKFLYKSETTMVVETYAWVQASTYKNLFGNAPNIIVRIKDNSTIEISVL